MHAEALDPFRMATEFSSLFATSYVPSERHAASATSVEIVASCKDSEDTLLVYRILPVSHSVRHNATQCSEAHSETNMEQRPTEAHI